LPATIVLELVYGLMVAAGIRGHRSAAGALALFTLATNAVYHRFWELEGAMAALEQSLFFKNVAIAGALLFVATQGTKDITPRRE
jgi:putative oxidoreductase